MSYTKSKHTLKRKLSEKSSLDSSQCVFEIDDDDHLSIRSLSITALGIVFAFLTLLIPSISIFVGRSFSQENEIIFNREFKKDGS